jgi:hypothetical protein
MVKDMSIALMSAAALLLTINLAVITVAMDPATLECLRAQILASAVLLGLSILLGTITISILIGHVEALSRAQLSIGAERTARWLSALQFWFFLFGMGAMIWAIVLRLY